MLDLSKIEAGKMTLYLEEFDVATMLDDVAATVRRSSRRTETCSRSNVRRTSGRCAPI